MEHIAPYEGFEPPTIALTARRSTTELIRNESFAATALTVAERFRGPLCRSWERIAVSMDDLTSSLTETQGEKF